MAADNPYNLNAGMKCVKYMLIIINFMFLLTSILLILVGTTIQTIFGDFKTFIYENFLSPPALLVAVGCILMIVATFGCFGALRESTMLINVYGVFLLLVFILEVAAAIAAFALQGQIYNMLVRTMGSALHFYETDEAAHAAVDFMQEGLQCCGVFDPKDWDTLLNVPEGNDTSKLYVPNSCCAGFNDDSQECVFYYTSGCLNRMVFVISQSATLIATGATTVAFVQLLGVVCAFMLAKTIRRTKSLRAARKWQLQHSLGLDASGKSVYDPQYTQLEKSELTTEPITYKSPSVN
ncbi:unnamed protein product [Hermetia illucens]|uniref:Tetraspanin n=1 Tax=Hermetia illucens TaxID=343691 RepID=A0A7R8YUF9_HERIL|nr:CD63 antigen [Hermetia illucens]CAD7085757.1 unnamed protein product [Hermetia illucens]